MPFYANHASFKEHHDIADEFAREVVKRAIAFASEEPLPDSAAMRPNSNTLVSKHVEAQLAYMKDTNYLFENSRPNLAQRTTDALETLANAHAERGVCVRVAQPWHRD